MNRTYLAAFSLNPEKTGSNLNVHQQENGFTKMKF